MKFMGERGQERRGRKPPEDIVREIFQRLQNGEPGRKLRQEYNIPKTTFYRELRRLNPSMYKKIMKERHPHHRIPVSRTWRRLENRESVRNVAAAYGMSHSSLRKKLERLDKQRYQDIMSKRGRQYIVPLPEIWKKLEDGETLSKVAHEYGIPPETLRHRLVNADRDRYMAIGRRRKLGTIPPEELFRKLASGESILKLAQEYNTYLARLQRILLRVDKERYQEIMERTRTIKSEGFGSHEAKIAGADSNFELQVKKILDDHNIQFCSPTLKLGRHRYYPDVMTSDGIIVEAAGVSNTEYWQRYREKTRNYAKHGYPVLVVVPYNLRKRARDYLPRSRMIVSVWTCDFKKDFEKYLKTLRSLKKVPINGSFPLSQEKLV